MKRLRIKSQTDAYPSSINVLDDGGEQEVALLWRTVEWPLFNHGVGTRR